MIESVTSNWKGTSASEPWTALLSPSTLITGPNGSGKSRVVEAIELALTGQVSSYLGRSSVKDPKMLWRAKAKGRGPLFVELTLSDGRVVRWEQGRSNGKPTRTGTIEGAVLGVSEVRANLFGSPKKAEQWFSAKLGLTLSEVFNELEAKMASSTLDFVSTFRTSIGFGEQDVDLFLKKLKEGARTAKREAEAAEALVEELEHVSGPYVSDEDLQKARKALTEAESAFSAAEVMHDRVGLLIQAHEEYQACGMQLNQLSTDTVDVKALECAKSVQAALDTVLRHYPQNTSCPCCRATMDIPARQREIQAFIESSQAANFVMGERLRFTQSMEQAKARGEKLLTLIPANLLPNAQGSPTSEAMEVAKLRLGQARAHLDELQRRRVSSQSPGMAKATVQEKLNKHKLYKEAAEVVEVVIQEKVDTTLDAFNEALQKCYPDHFGTPTLSLRPQVAVSVKRGGTEGVPSGGEEALLLLSIASVLAYLRHTEDPTSLNLLVMEDRGVDSETLDSILDLWQKNGDSYAQVIVPTTTKPSSVPDGWKCHSYWPTEENGETVALPTGSHNKVDPFEPHP